MKKIFLPLLLILFIFICAKAAYASTIFEDNFESGNSSNWTPVSGPNLWEIRNFNGNHMFGAHISNPSTLIDTVSSSVNTPNYQIEYDYMPVTGADRNLDFRFIQDQNSSGYNPYEVHYINSNYTFNNFGATPIASSSLIDNQLNHIKITLENQHVQFYVNGVKIINTIDPNYVFSLEKVGLRLSTGSSFPTEGWFDNIKVTTLDSPNNDLNVPLLKQTDPLWGTDLYDSANLWSTGSTDISRWGCAITSASMVLQYNNITKLPDGQDLTPGSLNNYLKSIPDGYIPNGMTNWHAISVMTKKAKINNPNFTYHALVDKYIGSNDSTSVNNDLSNNIPDILQVNTPLGSHFVVAKGTNSTSFNISDPFYNRTDLSQYNNSFTSAKRFVPSNTDLSYILLVVDPTVDILIKDHNGNTVGQSFVENPIGDPLDTLNNTKGPLREIIISEPVSDQYTIYLSSQNSQQYNLHSYLYDIDGNLKMIENQGVINQGTTNNYALSFDKNIINNTTFNQNVTIDTLNNDIVTLYSLGYIKKEFYKELLEKVKEIKKNQNKNGEGYVNKLKELNKEINKKKGIDAFASQILLNDLTQLINASSSSVHIED